MKNARALLIATIVISVFLLSFLIGRATALRSKEENSSENKIYMGIYNYNGEVEKNKISFKVPPIVSNYIWTKANSIERKRPINNYKI